MDYIPETYWHTRGVNYKAPGEEAEKPEIENLFYHWGICPLSIDSVLEIGSGYGRIYNEAGLWKIGPLHDRTFLDSVKFTMCDFVESMLYNCLRNTGQLPDSWDGNELPYNDAEFDLVISFSVLLHVTPDKIKQVLSEHARVSKRYIFIATYFGGLDQLAPHCFEHDYRKLFEELNLKIQDEKFYQSGLRVNWLLSTG